jgi:hypothetical protein
MIETIPTTQIAERDAAFFAITDALSAAGFADDTAVSATPLFARADRPARLERCWRTSSLPSRGNRWP